MKLNISQFLIGLDAEQERPWQVYVSDTLIQQENGSNPRIRQLGIKEVNQFVGLTEKTILYSVRIVQHAAIASLIRQDLPWALSFDGGVTKVPCRCLQIVQEGTQGVSWKIILER